MLLDDCLCCLALAYLFQGTIERTVLFLQNDWGYLQVWVPQWGSVSLLEIGSDEVWVDQV